MRKPIIAGNWKMNTTVSEAIPFTETLIKSYPNTDIETIIAPPFTHLSTILALTKNTPIYCAAQTLSESKDGAYTGDISANMIHDLGCSHVIIGHSERRAYHNETNELLNKKCLIAQKTNLIPLYCVGETESQRDNNSTLEVIKTQLITGLNNVTITGKKLIIAYEPVWAIGTGKVATPEQAQEVHAHIRNVLTTLSTNEEAENIRILYGGSVKPENSQSLLEKPDVDGALVGGACLNVNSFCDIIKTASTINV